MGERDGGVEGIGMEQRREGCREGWGEGGGEGGLEERLFLTTKKQITQN